VFGRSTGRSYGGDQAENVGKVNGFGMTNFDRFGAETLLEILLNQGARALFSILWSRASSPSNIVKGFHTTGIYPFASYVIPEEAFLSQ
jgi:hypothetical protein